MGAAGTMAMLSGSITAISALRRRANSFLLMRIGTSMYGGGAGVGINRPQRLVQAHSRAAHIFGYLQKIGLGTGGIVIVGLDLHNCGKITQGVGNCLW